MEQRSRPQRRLAASVKAVSDWIRGHGDDEKGREVIASLSKLQRGTGWVWAPETDILSKVEFPAIKTFDSMKAPEEGDAGDPGTWANIDLAAVRERMNVAIEEAKSNDPRALKAEIAKLKADATAGVGHDIAVAESAAYNRGFATGIQHINRTVDARLRVIRNLLKETIEDVAARCEKIVSMAAAVDETLALVTPIDEGVRSSEGERRLSKPLVGGSSPPGRSTSKRGNTEQRLLEALAELEAMHVSNPTREITAFLTGYSNIKSSPFVAAVGALKEHGHIEFPAPGTLALTDAGRRVTARPEPRTAEQIQRRIVTMLGGATGRILEKLVAIHPKKIAREDLAADAGYSNIKSSPFVDGVGKLRTLGFIEFPAPGQVRAADVLFLGSA